MQVDHRQIDNLLLPLLHADATASQDLFERLLTEQAAPLIRQIVRAKLCLHYERQRPEEVEDLQSEVLVQVLERLCAFRHNPSQRAIANFRSYVAVTTYHACYEHLRRKHPQYHQLKNRLRYLLTHRTEFALWEGEQTIWLSGFARWRTAGSADTHNARLQQLIDDPQAALNGRAERLNLAELLAALFDWVGQPIELDQLVNLVARLLGQPLHTPHSERDEEQADSDPFERLADPRSNVTAEIEARLQLQRLWDEIKQLPAGQRTALLLNLRDEQGGNVIALLPHTGTATLRQIAEALALPAIELAEVWPKLPLDDDAIALRLCVTRQQVINLRLAARRRLARRLKTQGERVSVA
jgi:RNA polymerase sigma factor (sigma-70 family)